MGGWEDGRMGGQLGKQDGLSLIFKIATSGNFVQKYAMPINNVHSHHQAKSFFIRLPSIFSIYFLNM